MGACLPKQSHVDREHDAAVPLLANPIPAPVQRDEADEAVASVLATRRPFSKEEPDRFERAQKVVDAHNQLRIQELLQQSDSPAAREELDDLINAGYDLEQLDYLNFHIDRKITENYQSDLHPLIYCDKFHWENLKSTLFPLPTEKDCCMANPFVLAEGRRYESDFPRSHIDGIFNENLGRRLVMGDVARQAQQDGIPLIGRLPKELVDRAIQLPNCSEETIIPINWCLKSYGLKIIELRRRSQTAIGQKPLYLSNSVIQQEVSSLIEKSIKTVLGMKESSSHFVLHGVYFDELRRYRYYEVIIAQIDKDPFFKFPTSPRLDDTLHYEWKDVDQNSPAFQRIQEEFAEFRDRTLIIWTMMQPGELPAACVRKHFIKHMQN